MALAWFKRIHFAQDISRSDVWRTGQCILHLVLVSLLLLYVRHRYMMEPPNIGRLTALTDQQATNISMKTVFFGHQSVGDDIIQGMKDLMAKDLRLKINVVRSEYPESVSKPAFIEFPIGTNRNPGSKDDAFDVILARGMGEQGGIAMYKYCYVDIGPSTDVQRLFQDYYRVTRVIKERYPDLRILHITVPLTTVETGIKAWVRTSLGRNTALNVNAKRNEFNNLLKHAFMMSDPIFDLAEVESTRRDGSRSYFMLGGKRVYTLAPEFTSDGGHLNEAGRHVAAERLLVVLSSL